MNKIEENNLKEINLLNQRGGRMLSILDLINANTLSLDMASYLLSWMQENPSLLTAALESGTGKTTLMGALLNLIRPGIKIKSISEVPSKPKEDIKYMVHEIGKGLYYSYLWEEIPDFFSLSKGTLVSGIHASNLEEIKKKLTALGVSEKGIHKLDLILIMENLDKRRVTKIYENINGFNLIYKWDNPNNAFEKVNESKFMKRNKNEIARARKFLEDLTGEVYDLSGLRKKLLSFLKT